MKDYRNYGTHAKMGRFHDELSKKGDALVYDRHLQEKVGRNQYGFCSLSRTNNVQIWKHTSKTGAPLIANVLPLKIVVAPLGGL